MTSMPRSEINFSRFFSKTCLSLPLVFEQYPWSWDGDESDDWIGDCMDTEDDGKTGESVCKNN